MGISGSTETILDMDKERTIEVLKAIQEDAQNDAKNLDGQPLTGLTMGTQLGNIFASIHTLASILEDLIKEDES